MLVFGHRGARAEAPENTVAGFRYARGIGLTAVEFDVRLTRDDRLVVIHDKTVDRTTDGTGAVADLTYRRIAGFDARGPFTDWPEPCRVPTLRSTRPRGNEAAHERTTRSTISIPWSDWPWWKSCVPVCAPNWCCTTSRSAGLRTAP